MPVTTNKPAKQISENPVPQRPREQAPIAAAEPIEAAVEQAEQPARRAVVVAARRQEKARETGDDGEAQRIRGQHTEHDGRSQRDE